MHTPMQARHSLLWLKRDWRAGRIDDGAYQSALRKLEKVIAASVTKV
jgi:hypothetical protein